MRLIIGPRSATVYWRRRVLVLAGTLLLIVVWARACTGGSDRPATTNAAPAAATGEESPTAEPAPDLLRPIVDEEPSRPVAVSESPSNTAAPSFAPLAPAAPAAPASPPMCADADIGLTLTAAPSPGVYGGTFTFRLTVRNTSNRTCLRDVGSHPQEIAVIQGSTLIWSSDHCGSPQAPDVRLFGPNVEARFMVQWSSYRVAPDDCRVAKQPAPPGAYQVFARLGTLVAPPTPLQIRR